MKQFITGTVATCSLTIGLAFGSTAMARPVYPESDMAAAVAICRADFRCIDYIQAAFCKVGMRKELDAVDQAGYRIAATQKMGAISERTAN